jgi:TP901 family phage tail tape measure protein
VLNIQKFNSLLNSSGLNLKKLGKDWASTGAVGANALRNLASATLTANMNLKRTDSLINKMGTTFLNTIKWTFASSVINSFTGSLQQSFGYIKSLDSSLNDIRIVTGKSADEMSKFAVKANDAAKALGKQTTDYTNAALIYYQQGLNEEESNTLAETTLKVSNITGQSAGTVSEEITAVMNGYKLGANQVEAAFDSLAAVAATTASDLSEISTGMSKVASTANMLGVPLDSLNAQLATIVSVTRQAPESVGTALKTIYARMNDLKLGKSDEDGIQLGDVSGSLEKMGIHILDEKKNLRDLGTVINEVAASWKTWTNEQRIAMAESLAGKRQYNNLIALFDNWDMYTKALNTSLSAQGTIAKQNGIYLDSLAAHMNQLKAAQEGVMDSFFDSKSFKGFIDFGTSALGVLEKIIDALGGGGTILGSLAALVGRVFSNQISKEIANAVINLKNYNFNLQQIKGSMEALKNF